ncbi:MAG: hypothetical protein K2X01_11280 [Cyanobacteria bacterium]|nr:hypothetical protein [Cyanobacteriota bacterium]
MTTWIRNRVQRMVGLFALLAFLLINFGNAQGMVLCFEPDGRVTLEASIGGVCSDSFQAEQHSYQKIASKKTTLHGLNCKHCVDIPISIETGEPHGSDIQAFQGPAQIPVIAQAPPVIVGYLATVTENILPHPPPVKPTIHTFLSTIVLLI